MAEIIKINNNNEEFIETSDNKKTYQLSKTRQILADKFVEILTNEKTMKWVRQWNSIDLPENAVTQRSYNGINRFILSLLAIEQGYSDNRWCTFKQAQDNGWNIIKGSKSTPVEFWFPYDKSEKKMLTFTQYNKLISISPEKESDITWREKTYSVFNGSQINNIPMLGKNHDTEFCNINVLDDFVENLQETMKIDVVNTGSEASYNIKQDKIFMPEKASFENEYAYYSTLLHEFSHSTGSENRMNRNIKNLFGTPDYAKEELRAEISSCFLSSDFNLDNFDNKHIENHQAYVQNWIKIIKNNPNELFSAINDADNIANYLKQKGDFELCVLKDKSEHLISIESTNNHEDKGIGFVKESMQDFYRIVGINEDYVVEQVNNSFYSNEKDCVKEIPKYFKDKELINYNDFVGVLKEIAKYNIPGSNVNQYLKESEKRHDKNLEYLFKDIYGEKEPYITIISSNFEHKDLKEGVVLTFAEADELFHECSNFILQQNEYLKVNNESLLNDAKTCYQLTYDYYNEKDCTFTDLKYLGKDDADLTVHIKEIIKSELDQNDFPLPRDERKSKENILNIFIPYLEKCKKKEITKKKRKEKILVKSL